MAIGFDCGTYNLVCCKRDDKGNFVHKHEVNAFIKFSLEKRFVFNMMKDIKVPLIERKDAGVAYALGEKAVDMAYTMGSLELHRPMLHGCLNPQEKAAQQIMSIMIYSLLDEASKNGETLYYSVPANAINEETDANYHAKGLDYIFKTFKDKSGNTVKAAPINEGLALIYAELADKAYSGIGISFGAGMVNLCYSMYAVPVFSFSLVNSGDWIDKQAAKATGESVAYINQEKLKTDLMVDVPDSLVQRAIKGQYEIMLQNTVNGIKKGLEEMGEKVHNRNPVDIVIAGGSSMPNGFEKIFEDILKEAHISMEIGRIIRPQDPLFSVARGCLIAAEAADRD